MRNTNSIPVDRVAARVIGTGEHFTPKGVMESILFEDLPTEVTIKPNPEFVDLKGQQFGRLSVIYYIGDSRWLVRCVCGQYFKQTTPAIKRRMGEKREAMCPVCEQRNKLKGPTRREMTNAEAREAIVVLQKQVAEIQLQMATLIRFGQQEGK